MTSSSGASRGPSTWSSGRAEDRAGRARQRDPRVACALDDIEFVILLLGAAAILVRLAESIAVPYPIVLVVGGLAIGLVPGLPDLGLDPDVVFLVFLPPLLHAAAWQSSPRELAAEVRPLALLSVGLVLATMCAVAVVAHAIVPGMSWEAAFVLGAIVGPTDPVRGDRDVLAHRSAGARAAARRGRGDDQRRDGARRVPRGARGRGRGHVLGRGRAARLRRQRGRRRRDRARRRAGSARR